MAASTNAALSCDRIWESGRNRVLGFRASARLAEKGVGGGGGGAGMLGASTSRNASVGTDSRSIRQYNAYRDTAYTAIRPIAVRIAGQPVRVGVKMGDARRDQSLRRKMLGWPGGLGGGEFGEFSQHQLNLAAKAVAPEFVRKNIGSNLDVIDDHPLLSALENPNPWMTNWALMYCTVVSLHVAGCAIWWMDGEGEETQFYYIPKTWAQPVHTQEKPFASWKIQPKGVSEPFPVNSRDIFYAPMPDPADPLGVLAPLQSQARSVNTDEQIIVAQHAAMLNGIRPGLALIAGRLPGVNGMAKGERPFLTPDQRTQLIESLRMYYGGAMRSGEPLILDGMIEDVKEVTRTPAELDFQGSSQLTKERIMEGIGTSPVVTGHSQNANRAGSYVANETWYATTVNPIISLLSECLSMQVAPRFDSAAARAEKAGAAAAPQKIPKSRLFAWIEQAKADDHEMTAKRVSLAVPALTRGEMRRYMQTGELDLKPRPDDDELMPAPGPRETAPPGGDPAATGPKVKPKPAPKAPGKGAPTKKTPAAPKKAVPAAGGGEG